MIKLPESRMLGLCTFLCLLLYSIPVSANAPAKTLPVGTCINIGNTLEGKAAPADAGKQVSKKDFVRIREAGFETVRVPVRWYDKSLSEPPYTIDPAWIEEVAKVVSWAIQADLNVILDSHKFRPIHSNPVENTRWHSSVWRQIGERFKKFPDDRLWFELENEPSDKLTNANLIETLGPALSEVRKSNPTRPVIFGGDKGSGVWSLRTLTLPDDPNVYPTFHYYEPFGFTHQGAAWLASKGPPPGRSYGSDLDHELMERHVRAVRNYIDRTGKIPFIGEVGVYDRHVSTSQRAKYHRTVFEYFAPIGVGICSWAYANTFPFFDREREEWLPGMLAAIGLPDRK